DLERIADPGYAGKLRPERGTLDAILRGEIPILPEDVRHVRALYGAVVASVDREIARLISSQQDLIRSGRVIVVVTGDHGEQFLEHDQIGHGHSLYQPAVHVPLIVAGVRGAVAGGAVPEPVGLIDLAPTILALAGLPPEPAFRGENLAPLMMEGAPPLPRKEPIASDVEFADAHARSHWIRAGRAGRWKIILSAADALRAGP